MLRILLQGELELDALNVLVAPKEDGSRERCLNLLQETICMCL